MIQPIVQAGQVVANARRMPNGCCQTAKKVVIIAAAVEAAAVEEEAAEASFQSFQVVEAVEVTKQVFICFFSIII